MTGYRVREFFRQLIGSRVASLLEEQLVRQRQDYDQRLNERDEVIAGLKQELVEARGKLDRYELALIPLVSPVGNLLNPPRKPPTFEPVLDTPQSWAEIQRKIETDLQREYQEELDAKKEK